MQTVAKLLQAWRSFRESLLFTPALMTIGALVVFALTTRVDRLQAAELYALIERTGSGTLSFLVFTGSASAAESILSALVGTWATIVGVVFSVTLVTIQLSATKYSAQVIPLFERDRLNQIVLGTFTATFVYSLLVLKTVRTEDGESFVPLVGVNLAILLAIVSLFLLIAFIGNLTAYIRPTRFVSDYAELGRSLVPNYNVPREEDDWRPVQRTPEPEGGDEAPAATGGVLAAIEWPKLRKALEEENPTPERVEFLVPVGRPVAPGRALVRVHGGTEGAAKRLLPACQIEPNAQKENPALVAETLADVCVTALSGGSTDVGVAKRALRGLLDITRVGLEDPALPQAFLVDAGGRNVLVQRRQDPFYRLAYREMARVLDKARREGYWDVGEEAVRALTPVLRQAVGTSAWAETLQWLRALTHWLVRIDDDEARRRILANLNVLVEEMRRDGHDEEATQVVLLLREVAEEAGAGAEARELLGRG